MALGPSPPAWKQQWDKIVNAGKREGSVVVFGPAGETIRTVLVESFKKSFPEITLEFVGGRAAEHLVFDQLSTGAADDLAKATDIARSMVTRSV